MLIPEETKTYDLEQAEENDEDNDIADDDLVADRDEDE